MTTPAYLVLEDGSRYRGEAFGARTSSYGEVVFSTSMTGYQEMLTDPSFAGQIVMPTYPLIGNYGINARDVESRRVQVSGFVVRRHDTRPSHSLSDMTLDEYLQGQGIAGIAGVDTRAITRRLRSRGVMMGAITVDESPEVALRRIAEMPPYADLDLVTRVSTEHPYVWDEPLASVRRQPRPSGGRHIISANASFPPATASASMSVRPQPSFGSQPPPRILVSDYGLKYNILRMLRSRGCEVVAMPAAASAQAVLDRQPDGVLLSPGPGNPELLDYAVETATGLLGRVPILGICLGNQVLGRAFGGRTFKLKFGHRGANHPVRDLATGRVYITSQNHGFAVDADTLPSEVEVSHVNLNDGTVEGLRHRSLPVMSIQYHSEASPGPLDNEQVFDHFLDMVRDCDTQL